MMADSGVDEQHNRLKKEVAKSEECLKRTQVSTVLYLHIWLVVRNQLLVYVCIPYTLHYNMPTAP
jgi:hypothetical protein